ncbi:MAG: permease-like cell division protein FtsX [Paludibacteraceae bacterium]|jgi:cell division transport system permease protein|nr:permease-like cell division protein FtsX [Paludibacteraceae bacterium]
MSKQPKVKTSKFFNSNLTTMISIAIVLFLVGIITTLSLVVWQTGNYVKENISFTVVINDSMPNSELQSLLNHVKNAPYTKSTKFISKDMALAELSNELGEDPQNLLGYNPLSASIEVKASATYANSDSIFRIQKELAQFKDIDEFIYQKNMMNDVNHNLQITSAFLAAIALIMLLISIALINNTIRLQIYSKRFTINTMRMVGATSWFIRKPFLLRAVLNGFLAALITCVILFVILFYVQNYYGFEIFTLVHPLNLAVTGAVIFTVGILISLLSSLFAVGKYLRLDTNDLYII